MKMKLRTFYSGKMYPLTNFSYIDLSICSETMDDDIRQKLEYSSSLNENGKLLKVCLKNKMLSTLNNTKDGYEIYEGDILKLEDGKIGMVYYESDRGGFVVQWCGEKFNKRSEGDTRRDLDCDVAYTSKHLGNVYENPELRENCFLAGSVMKDQDFDIYF